MDKSKPAKKKGGRKRRTFDKIKLVHLVDSGGQSQFQEVLSMFARNSSAHLLVHSLEQDLDHIPLFQYEVGGKEFQVQQDMKLTHRDIITRYVRSTCSSRYRKGVQKASIKIPGKPHIAIVGMFKDKISSTLDSSLEEKNQQVKHSLDQLRQNQDQPKFEVMTPSRDLSKPVFAFDGSEDGWNGNGHELDKLRQFIGDEKRMISVKLPLRWFLFLQIIKEHSCTSKKEYLTLDTCKEVAKDAIAMSPEDVEEALELFDELNLLLHYSTILPNIVFTKPAFLYRKVTEIMVASFTNLKESDTLRTERLNFHDSGMFSLDLLKNTDFTTVGFDQDFKLKDLLTLLQDLFIISSVGENLYFMPCVLPLESNDSNSLSDPEPEDPEPLYISFADNCSPQGLFCATVTCLAEMPAFSIENSHGSNLRRKRDLIELVVQRESEDGCSRYSAGSIILWDKLSHFQVTCAGCDKSFLPQVRSAVRTAIFNATDVMHYDVQQLGLKIGFKCSAKCGIEESHGNAVSCLSRKWSYRCQRNPRKHAQPLAEKEKIWYLLESNSVEVEPNLKDLQNDIACKTVKWKAIALQLEVHYSEIERIEVEQCKNIDHCFIEVFNIWKQSDRVLYCWTRMVKALEAPSVNLLRLAKTITEKYLC